MDSLLVLKWNQDPCITLEREINILTYLDLKLLFLSLHAAWDEQFAPFGVKSTSLLPGFNVKSTF